MNDELSGGTDSVDVTYMTSGAGGAVTAKTATITVGAGTSYSDTAQGLIQAINGAGLGLTASFTTAAQAGTAASAGGKGADMGIEISGLGSGVAGAANGAGAPGVNGTLGANGALTLTGGTMTINGKIITLGLSGHQYSRQVRGRHQCGRIRRICRCGDGQHRVADAVHSQHQRCHRHRFLHSGDLLHRRGDARWREPLSDTATGKTPGTPASDINGTGGIATVSYSDAAGENLSGTDLVSQSDAEASLSLLNLAISDVAAQDGYIGAQINTLNSISQVMSTQQENVVSAQNAIQATDYAAATSNMSKYEILSQTGIAALAQANSVQQEVTKLLQ